MNIVCSTDNNFVQHCCIMLTSVLKHNTDVIIYLITEGLTNSNLQILKDEVENKGGELHVITIDSSIISKFPMPELNELTHVSPATYNRLLISHVLPKSINKVLYLDCDIIVRRPLTKLWDINIDNFAVGAVSQISINTVEETQRLGYPAIFGYFNAGVLLINLDHWRVFGVFEKLMNYLISNYNIIKYHDQDALNAVLYNNSLRISCDWNMLSSYFSKDIFMINDSINGRIINEYSDYKNQLKKSMKDPSLIHYVSTPKPWSEYSVHPFRKEYYKYSKFSIFYNTIKPKKIVLSNCYYLLYKVFVINIYKVYFKGRF